MKLFCATLFLGLASALSANASALLTCQALDVNRKPVEIKYALGSYAPTMKIGEAYVKLIQLRTPSGAEFYADVARQRIEISSKKGSMYSRRDQSIATYIRIDGLDFNCIKTLDENGQNIF